MYRGPALELLTELPRTLLVLVAPGISEVCAPHLPPHLREPEQPASAQPRWARRLDVRLSGLSGNGGTRVLPEPACSIRQLAAPHARAWPFCMGFSSGSSVGCLVWHLVLAWAGWRSELEPGERSAAQAASRAPFGYTRRRKGGATKALSVALP